MRLGSLVVGPLGLGARVQADSRGGGWVEALGQPARWVPPPAGPRVWRCRGRPQASLPNSQAVAPARSPARRTSSERLTFGPVGSEDLATVRRELATSAAGSPPAITGRWKIDPHWPGHAGLYASTLPSVRDYRVGPSGVRHPDDRSRVAPDPGPGRARRRASACTGHCLLEGDLGIRQTATTPCGVTVEHNSFTTAPEARCHGMSAAAAPPATRDSVCRPPPSRRPRRHGRHPRAPRTACGPSARNRRSAARKARLCRRLARATGATRAEVISMSAPRGGGFTTIQAASVAGTAARATSTNAAKAAGRSLPTRPTSDGRPQPQREPQPWMKRLYVIPLGPRGGRVDPLDPQPTEVALAVTTVAVGVDHRVGDLFPSPCGTAGSADRGSRWRAPVRHDASVRIHCAQTRATRFLLALGGWGRTRGSRSVRGGNRISAFRACA